MAEIIRNVGDIDPEDRRVLEHVLGQRLGQNQQLVIRVINLNVPPTAHQFPGGIQEVAALPDWCDVYAGLSDEEIAELEKSILTRADLSRDIE
jgi:hypothetical protein